MLRSSAAVLLAASLSLVACHRHGAPKPDAPAAKKDYPDVPNMNEMRWANAMQKAAKELGVAVEQLQYESFDHGRFGFKANGKDVEYALYCLGWSCVWLDDPRTRAAFDLNCPREQLLVTFIDEKTRGITGCDRRATYLAHVSPNYEVTWLMNSAAAQ